MPSLDDPLKLEETFKELAARLKEQERLTASRSDPLYYFAYRPQDALEVRRRIPVWEARLRNDGLEVQRVSFSDLLWEIIDASGRWEEWLKLEADFEQAEANEALRSVLRDGNPMIDSVGALVGTPQPGRVLFLTDTETLHPYFRARVLENTLHDRIKVPTVIFYPGRRAGQYGLHFLDFYREDSNYRATILGGLP